MTFNTKQLFSFADTLSSTQWRVDVLVAGLGRCHDYQNLDTIKHHAKSPEVSKLLYQRIGILNLFSPLRPNGEYVLNLAMYEEKQVAKILCELARSEGFALMTEVKVAGTVVEKMSNDVLRGLPDKGKFECKYDCPEEKMKPEAREKLGQKFFEWPLN